MGVHLFVPMLHRHDAVGEHTMALRDRLSRAGAVSRIYTQIPDPGTADQTCHYLDYESDAEAGDVLVYQFATESAMVPWLVGRSEPVVINYHSITPPEYFWPWSNGITRLQVGAQIELGQLAPRAALGIAVSHFDEEELQRAGCARTTVIPVAQVAVPPVQPDPAVVDRLLTRDAGRGPRWLSVGRLAPNKCHHQTIAALFVARATMGPTGLGPRLTVVGAPSEPTYARALRRYAAALGLAESVELVTGLSDAELAARYRAADVLVMLSEHEGYGVPLVEAMGQGLPVVAFDAGAVREVLGDGGVVLANKHPRHVADSVSRLLADGAEQSRLVEAGRARFAALGLADAGDRLVEALRDVAEQPTSAR